MALYLITFDIGAPALTNPELIEKIEKFGDHLKISDTVYAIDTVETPAEMYLHLKHSVGREDQLYIFEIGQRFSGCGPKETIQWLNRELEHLMPA